MSPLVCCVDGNIGSGKTTVLKCIAERGFNVLCEDIDEWQPYLNLFYTDPTRWSFTLQMETLQSLILSYDKISACENGLVFVERDPLSCKIFSKNSYKLGFMIEEEHKLFEKCHRLFDPWKPDVRCVLNVSIDECLKRIQSRSRNGENNITLDYLKSLNQEYKILCEESPLKFFECKCVKVDGNQSIDRVVDDIFDIVTAYQA